MNLRKIYRGPHGSSLSAIYHGEEIRVERQFNRFSLAFIAVSLVSSVIFCGLYIEKLNVQGSRCSIYGLLILLLYQVFIAIVLRKDLYHWIIKYITLTFLITALTIILCGHSINVKFIDTIRIASLLGYFTAIILSGFYQNPRLSLYSACLSAAEYCLLSLYIQRTLFDGYIESWTFIAYPTISFILNGFIMFIYSRRNRLLMLNHKISSERLVQEKEERRISEQKAAFIESHDEMTGMPNLKSFTERLDRQLIMAETRKQYFAIMCIGIDSFRNINQLQGRESGNRLLMAVAERLNSAFREDDFICRFMGDKFLVLFNDLKPDCGITDLIRKTRQAFEIPFKLEKSTIKASVSGGFCTFPYEAGTGIEMIKRAESAMDAAKKEGKDKFFLFNKNEQEKLEKRLVLEAELEHALEREELFLMFQPKVDSVGRMIGMESLLRWKNPELGLVPPDVFIPIAERTGSIISIGTWVLRKTCLQIKDWADEGFTPVRVSVNVSPCQLEEKDFTNTIQEIIKETGIKPEWLGIEITESVIMRNELNIGEILRDITGAGVKISIDDFGKGYSSLSRLGVYELSTLKIDKSFIDGLPGSEVSGCLVRSIIDLAHNLGYSVVAEGVENIEQAEFLNSCGCDSIQGYFYYRPLEPDMIKDILDQAPMRI